MVPSEADDGSTGTRASVLRAKIRTFLESLVDCEKWTEEELIGISVRAAAGNEFKELAGIDDARRNVVDTYQKLCAECYEYLPQAREKGGKEGKAGSHAKGNMFFAIFFVSVPSHFHTTRPSAYYRLTWFRCVDSATRRSAQ